MGNLGKILSSPQSIVANMQISRFDSIGRKVSVAAITGYQKHISPHKGFACAHRVLYGGESCSQYIKGIIAHKGLKAAVLFSRQRFQACKEANQILHSQAENSEPTQQDTQQPKKTRNKTVRRSSFVSSDGCNNNNDCADCTNVSCDCANAASIIPDCASLDCGAADCNALDCSAADCGSLDCGAADCGSCGG